MPAANARYQALVIDKRPQRCEQCGQEGPIDVHHRDGDASNNTSANLELLCHACHLTRHRTKKMRRNRRGLSKDELIQELNRQIREVGGIAPLARTLGLSYQYIYDAVNHRRAIGRKLLAAMGYEEDVQYLLIPDKDKTA